MIAVGTKCVSARSRAKSFRVAVAMSSLLVENPGLLTTVQDLGRPGYGALGVSLRARRMRWRCGLEIC